MKNKFIAILAGLLLSVLLCNQPAMAWGTYGPTAANETLWSIASRLRPSYAVSTQQMMLALRFKNPHAFNNPNINSLKKGTILRIPTQAEIRRFDRSQALRIARQHNTNWKAPYNIYAKAHPQYRVKAKSRTKTSATRYYSKVRLQREITVLRQQLRNEQRHSARLQAQLKTLEASGKSTTKTTATVPTPETQKLQLQVAELKASIDEKNNHIKNLQVSLKEASDSIKRQYAESQMLYDQLKAAAPDKLPPPPHEPNSAPKLTLSGVGGETQTPANTASVTQQANGKPAVFTDQVPANQQTPAKTMTKDDPATPPTAQGKLPLKTLLEQQAAKMGQNASSSTAEPEKIGTPAENVAQTKPLSNAPSRLSLIVALISLLFILALLWRAFNQRQETKTPEPQEKNKVTPETEATASDNTEINLKTKADGRQEPDILL